MRRVGAYLLLEYAYQLLDTFGEEASYLPRPNVYIGVTDSFPVERGNATQTTELACHTYERIFHACMYEIVWTTLFYLMHITTSRSMHNNVTIIRS